LVLEAVKCVYRVDMPSVGVSPRRQERRNVKKILIVSLRRLRRRFRGLPMAKQRKYAALFDCFQQVFENFSVI